MGQHSQFLNNSKPDMGQHAKPLIDPKSDVGWQSRFQKSIGINPDRYILSNPGDIIVAEQLHCYPKAEKKFPTWHRPGMVYTRLALEQSSGEIAAQFKSGLMKGIEIWDLTGGLGMDAYAFSQTFESVHYCEPTIQPFTLAVHNHDVLGAKNIRHHLKDAASAIESLSHTDWMYLDPSRRDESGRKFLLKDCEPDVLSLLDEMKRKASGIMIKLSPMYDLNQLLSEIPSINHIYVVSVSGEVREILVLIDDASNSTQVTAVILPDGIAYTSTFPVITQSVAIQHGSLPEKGYLHVADVSIFKAGLTHQIISAHQGQIFGSGGYFISTNQTIPGCKSYALVEEAEYKPKELRRRIKNLRVNIHKRNFSIEVSDLYKALGTAMGDDLHLFFTQMNNGKKMVAICEPPVSQA